MSRDFQFNVPDVRLFKGDDGQMRIAGVVSTDAVDQQGDRVLQDGLDFNYFLKRGWYNDNHSSKTSDILGYPERVQFFQKGDTLPDGSRAPSNCHWSEGYLLPDYEPAKRIWELGRSLSKAKGGRALGFSVEGKIKKRAGPGRKIIAKAEVRNVAITNCPVNTDTKLITLAKSLHAAEQDTSPMSAVLVEMIDRFGEPTSSSENFYFWKSGDCEVALRRADDEDAAEKALSMTTSGGTGAGAVLSPESLEREPKTTTYGKFGKSEAVDLIRTRLGVQTETAERVYRIHQALVDRGLLR